MQLSLNTKMIDAIIRQWESGMHDYTVILSYPHFQAILSHAQDFQKVELNALDYLYDLLHIDGIDMQDHLAEIQRNLATIRSVNLEQIALEVQGYLPESTYSGRNVQICPMIGIAGLALDDLIVIDPSPCPWFPADGSDKNTYLSSFILPTLRHELHHVGYMCLHETHRIAALITRRDLAVDYAQQFQMEGSALLCQWQQNIGTLDRLEYLKLRDAFCHHYDQIQDWLRTPEHPIEQKDWNAYYALWSDDKPVYWLGQSLCTLLIQCRAIRTVAEYIQMEPLRMMQTARACFSHSLSSFTPYPSENRLNS